MIEYERKILLRRFNFGDLASSKFGFRQEAILQGYAEDGTRYRRTLIPNKESQGISVVYHETAKTDTDIPQKRKEEEKEISGEEFKEGFSRCEVFIDKVRYSIEMDGYEVIVDTFHEEVATLTMCEIEILRSVSDSKIVEELNNVKLPDFIEREIIMEVTEMEEFKNKNLAIPLDSVNKEELHL